MNTKVGVAVALILAASMSRAGETLSELLSRSWSIKMTPCRAWPLHLTDNTVCLLTGSGEALEQSLTHLSGADVAYLRSLKMTLPSKGAFYLPEAINAVSAAIDRYTDLLQAAQSNRVEGTVVTDGSLVALVPRRRLGWGRNMHCSEFTNSTHAANNEKPPREREYIRPEVWSIHQQSTTAVNVREVNRLKQVLKDLEDKKKALLCLARVNPRLLPANNRGPLVARLKELNEMLRQNLITREEYEAKRKEVIDAIGQP